MPLSGRLLCLLNSREYLWGLNVTSGDFMPILAYILVVGIATSYGLDDRGGRSSSPGEVKNFLFSRSSRPVLRSTQPPIQWVPGVKRTGREVDHSPPTSAEVKKMWLYTSTPIRLYGVVLS
jgi:hypothetical protein